MQFRQTKALKAEFTRVTRYICWTGRSVKNVKDFHVFTPPRRRFYMHIPYAFICKNMYAVYAFGCILGIVRMTNSDSTTRPKSPTFATVNLKKRNSSHQKTNKPQPKIHPDQPSKQHPSKYKKATKKTSIHTTKVVDQRQAQLLNFN